MMLEVLRMIDTRHWGLAAGYLSASIACGLAAVFVSTKLVRSSRPFARRRPASSTAVSRLPGPLAAGAGRSAAERASHAYSGQ